MVSTWETFRLLELYFGNHRGNFKRDKKYFPLGKDLFILFNLIREIGFICSESFKGFSKIGQGSFGHMLIYEY
jgi:hypothetical protein